MSVILKTEKGDILWFSATLSVTDGYSSTVTKYPVEDGTSKSDFIFQNNPTLYFSGIISDVDLGSQIPDITPDINAVIGSNTGNFVNVLAAGPSLDAVQVTTSGRNPLMGLAPDVAQQFMPSDTIPTVTVTSAPIMASSETVKAFLKSIRDNNISVNIYEYGNGKILASYTGYYITKLSFPKSVASGTALQPAITLEQVRFASLVTNSSVPPLIRAMLPIAKGDATASGTSVTATGDATASTAKAANGQAPIQAPVDESLLYKGWQFVKNAVN